MVARIHSVVLRLASSPQHDAHVLSTVAAVPGIVRAIAECPLFQPSTAMVSELEESAVRMIALEERCRHSLMEGLVTDGPW